MIKENGAEIPVECLKHGFDFDLPVVVVVSSFFYCSEKIR